MTRGDTARPLSLGTLRALVGAQIAFFFGAYLWTYWKTYPRDDVELGHTSGAFWVIAVMGFPLLGIALHALLRRGRQGRLIGSRRSPSYQARTLLATALISAVGLATCVYSYAEARFVTPWWAMLSALLLQQCWPSRRDIAMADSATSEGVETHVSRPPTMRV